MSISFYTFHRVVWVIVKLIKHHLIHFVVHGHRFLTRKQSFRPLVLLLFEPRVSSYFLDAIPFLRVCIQYLRNKMCAVLRQKLRDFVVTSKNFLVKVRCFGVFEWEEPAYHGVEHDATAPDVGFEAEILLASDHFWCCIAR